MKIAVVTAGSPDFAELASITVPSKQRYAEKWGYSFFRFESKKEDGDKCKFDAYMQLRDKGYDVCFWSDDDALVMNSDWRIEDILHYEMGYDPTVSMDKDIHFLWGWDGAGPNSGVYFARFTPQAYHFMDRYTATMLENGLGDNTAMIQTMLIPPFNQYVKCIRGTLFNAYDYAFYGWDKYGYSQMINKYEPGSFMLQMPGISNDIRIPELRKRALEAT